MHRAVASLALVVLLAAAPPSVTWQGVTLGVPVLTLRPVLGDPLRIVTSDDGQTQVRRYWIAGEDTTFFLVVSKRGYVEGLHVFTSQTPTGVLENVPPDPSGVRLGDTLESVKALHPDFRAGTSDDGTPELSGRSTSPSAGIVYEFAGGRVRSFHWAARLNDTLPAQVVPAETTGVSFETAILDAQKEEMSGVRWEYMYVAFHPCDKDTRWKPQQQALLHQQGKSYDRLHTICPTTNAERDFYFDITPYFGKL